MRYNMTMNLLLSVSEVAQRLNLSIAMVRRYCQQGRIEAYKIGRDWVIPESSIEKFKQEPRKVGKPGKVNND